MSADTRPMTLPIVERLRRDFDGQPFDTAICRDVRTALDTIEELVKGLEQIAQTPNAGWMIARSLLAKLGGDS